MNILGISAFYHDSAAALIRDGEITAAAQEERFTRVKHDQAFPASSVEYCLKSQGLTIDDVDIVAFYDKPFLKFERILETYLSYAPLGVKSFIKAMPVWIKQKLWMKEVIKNELGFSGKVLFPSHHQSHAASAFYPSPFKKAAFLAVDGVGEWATTSYGTGDRASLTTLAEVRFPHSLGLLYSAFTYYTGFKVNSGEYKVMGLAPYGEPTYKGLILDKLMDLKEDGSFKLDMKYFNYCAGLTMTSEAFHKLFGGPPRKPESNITQREMDLARSVQEATEEVVVRLARHIREETGERYLCMAGGVALNCVANGKLLREGIFDDIWIQPAAGDAGGALGAALMAWHGHLGKPKELKKAGDLQRGSYLGPEYKREDILEYLTRNSIPYKELNNADMATVVADKIAEEKVVGWFQGPMEFGPRSLGGRSILGDARSTGMQETMNLKIKFRESFRPFAPAVLAEKVSEYFEIDRPSPYMLLVAPVKKALRREMTGDEEKLFGIEKLNIARSTIPAVTHVDYTARIQTVHRDTNPLFHDMITTLNEEHGTAVVVNTSFNVRGEPIVCTPEDAYRCFMRTDMDFLSMGNFLLDKTGQTPLKEDIDWRKEFTLD